MYIVCMYKYPVYAFGIPCNKSSAPFWVESQFFWRLFPLLVALVPAVILCTAGNRSEVCIGAAAPWQRQHSHCGPLRERAKDPHQRLTSTPSCWHACKFVSMTMMPVSNAAWMQHITSPACGRQTAGSPTTLQARTEACCKSYIL